MKICYVCHRYAPYPGGTEYYVQQMAEETLKRGHDVTVFTSTHMGDLNGVKVTNIFEDIYDLIVVHGSDVGNQDYIHSLSEEIQSKVLYQIIKPSDNYLSVHGLLNHQYLAWSTEEDLNHIKKYNQEHKAVNVRHGLNAKTTIVNKTNFKEKYNIKTERMFVSAGGFYPHKGMIELSECFEQCNFNDTTLVLLGYSNGSIPTPKTDKVKIFLGLEHNDILNAISEANLYIMNSYEEGFGLVLIEAMMNKTPWLARNIAGAKLMNKYGYTFNNQNELIQNMKYFMRDDELIENAFEYVMNNHTIEHTVNDIEAIL